MKEYFSQNYFYILNEGVIILTGAMGLLFLKKFKHTDVRYFIYFLIYVVFVELLGYYPRFSITYDSLNWLYQWKKGTLLERNHLWYAIFWEIGSALFLSFYFFRVLKGRIYKKIIKNATLIYSLGIIISLVLFYQVYYTAQMKLIWFLGVIQIMLCVVIYFLELLNSDKIMSFYKSMNFYIAAVFFIYFLIYTPLVFYQIYYSTADWEFIFLRRDIILFANMFMYLTFAFAFIWCKPDHPLKTNHI